MRFKIHGADRETGEESVFEIEAPTAQDARSHANAAGYLVSSLHPMLVTAETPLGVPESSVRLDDTRSDLVISIVLLVICGSVVIALAVYMRNSSSSPSAMPAKVEDFDPSKVVERERAVAKERHSRLLQDKEKEILREMAELSVDPDSHEKRAKMQALEDEMSRVMREDLDEIMHH